MIRNDRLILVYIATDIAEAGRIPSSLMALNLSWSMAHVAINHYVHIQRTR